MTGLLPSLIRFFGMGLVAASLTACALPPRANETEPLAAFMTQLTQTPSSQAMLLGEQHDIPEHQQLHHRAVLALSGQQQLAALALEMAEQGYSTAALAPVADEKSVRAALGWDAEAWPWAAYGPAIMAAVRAGVPVLGANLSSAHWRHAMQNTALDAQLPGPALQAQQQAIRTGHCDLLPESQIAPMTRIQIARDLAMAASVLGAARPGKTVLLLAGHGHVNRALGVPQHLPAGFTYQAILLQAAPMSGEATGSRSFDTTLSLGTAPQTDYCAAFSASQSVPKTP